MKEQKGGEVIGTGILESKRGWTDKLAFVECLLCSELGSETPIWEEV